MFLAARDRWLDENDLAFVIDQPEPWGISPGHRLICPKRIVPTIFDMTMPEWDGCRRLLLKHQALLARSMNPDGFNVGANCSEAAGQTVMHAHIHLIPRYFGDDPNPRGGIRACIPGKKSY